MAEPTHSIPSKQRHYSGKLQDLARNLLTREIGFCTEDNRCYGKIIDSTRPEDLIPLGGKGYVDPPPTDQLSLLLGMPNGSNDWVRLTTKRIGSGSTQSEDMWYELDGCKFAAQRAEKNAQGRDIQAKLEGSPGVEVDQDNCVVRLTERSTFQPSRGDLIKGALQIIEGSSATRYQVRIGQSEALGALIPIAGPGKHGWVLRSNDSAGKVEWVKPADLFSSDGSIKISDNGTDPLTAALTIERVSTEKLEGYIRAENLEDSSIPAEKLEIRKKLMVDGTTIGATETQDTVVLQAIALGNIVQGSDKPVSSGAVYSALQSVPKYITHTDSTGNITVDNSIAGNHGFDIEIPVTDSTRGRFWVVQVCLDIQQGGVTPSADFLPIVVGFTREYSGGGRNTDPSISTSLIRTSQTDPWQGGTHEFRSLDGGTVTKVIYNIRWASGAIPAGTAIFYSICAYVLG